MIYQLYCPGSTVSLHMLQDMSYFYIKALSVYNIYKCIQIAIYIFVHFIVTRVIFTNKFYMAVVKVAFTCFLTFLFLKNYFYGLCYYSCI